MLLHDVFRLYLVYFLFVHSFDMFERFWTLNLPIIATVFFQCQDAARCCDFARSFP